VTPPFWRRPIWILGHVIALSACVLFVRLGLWQLDRLEEKKDRNRIIAARADGPADDILAVPADEAEYAHVTATGTFEVDQETLIGFRSYEGSVGSHVVTPMALGDGIVVLVNRGWIPDGTDPPPPPRGEVTVEGLLRASQDKRFGVDVEEIASSVDGDVLPMWLAQAAPPPDGDYPIRLDPPARDEGPHLSYAIQWFLFTGVVVVGYPLLLRKRARTLDSSAHAP